MRGVLLCSTGGLQRMNKHYTRLMERLQNHKNNTYKQGQRAKSINLKDFKASWEQTSNERPRSAPVRFENVTFLSHFEYLYKSCNTRDWDSYPTSEKEKEWCCNQSAGSMKVFLTGCCLCADLPGGDPWSNQTQKQSLLLDLTTQYMKPSATGAEWMELQGQTSSLLSINREKDTMFSTWVLLAQATHKSPVMTLHINTYWHPQNYTPMLLTYM